jgi:hypothetical protein
MQPSKHSLLHHHHFWINVFSSPDLYYHFTPVLDGQVITDYPDSLFLQGNYAKVPIIVGYSPFNSTSSGRRLSNHDLDTSQTRLLRRFRIGSSRHYMTSRR